LLLISFEFPHLRSSLFLAGLAPEGRGCTSVAGGIVLDTRRKHHCAGVCPRGDAGDLIRKMALLEGELAEACQTQ
jgi:hypothetical protein